jgi:hypothetical protein
MLQIQRATLAQEQGMAEYRVFQGNETTQIDEHTTRPAEAESWYYEPSDYAGAYSGRRLPLIPVETCHRFQSKVATDSD